MTSLRREELAAGVVRYALSAGWPRPHIAICGGIHGNEVAGVGAVRKLAAALESGGLSLSRGTIILIEGNPKAIEQGRRHTQGGTDLNRLWEFVEHSRLVEGAWTYEHHRSWELRDIVCGVDALLDLHTTSRPTPPFSIDTQLPDARELAREFGLPFAIARWNALGDRVLSGFLASQAIPSLVVECGAHDDPRSAQVARSISARFLQHYGVADPPNVWAPPETSTTVEIVEVIKKPSESFAFARPLSGFEPIAAGAVLGRDRLTEIRIHQRCFAVMPNEGVAVGDDLVYLGVQVVG